MQKQSLIGIVSRDDDFSAATSAALGVAGARLRRIRSWSEWSQDGDEPALLVFDGSRATPEDLVEIEARTKPGRARSLCMMPDDGATIATLTRHGFLDCVVSRGNGFQTGELAAVAANLLTHRVAGVEAYLTPGTSVCNETLKSYAEKDACFERLQKFAASLPAFADFPQVVVSVVWEMLMNALIDAPSQVADAKATPSKQNVELRYGSDQKHLAVSVQDHYGTLTRAKVVENLARSHRQGPDQIRSGKSGAGIGLYLMFSHASQLHFSVKPGVSTKVVLVMRVSKRFGEFTEGGRAFDFMLES